MDYQALVDMAVTAGEIMLVSGAEVYRIEDTVARILRRSGFKGIEVFVVATGIFATLSDPSIRAITVIRRVGRRSSNLNRICRVNDVSRRFCKGELELGAAAEELNGIASRIQYGPLWRAAGYVLTSAFFAVLFGGGALECFAAGLTGMAMAAVSFGFARFPFNDFCQNAACAFTAALTALALQSLALPSMNVDAVIISAIMPLVPGVTFTSAIRDTLNGDYSSGVARIAEAVVVALAVACGVGAAMLAVRFIGGVL